MTASAEATGSDLSRVQRRTVLVLSAGQVLGGLGFGATVSLGTILTAEVTGNKSLAGLAVAAIGLGTAVLAMPLAQLARRAGRRPSLATGMAIALVGVSMVIIAVGVGSFPMLLLAYALVGAGQAANLQSRFAATDLASDTTRGRDLSIVVWATTIGAVLGPNLTGPGDALGAALGMPPLTGPYAFTVIAQVCAIALYLIALRPDPLRLAERVSLDASTTSVHVMERPDAPRAARYAIFAIAASHGVMVSVMAMTPVHLLDHGASIEVIGLTISLHIAGMYALSPVFGFLADRWGRARVILLGQLFLAASLLTVAIGPDSTAAVVVALLLLGLGWSATTVAGSALLTEASAVARRTRRQGFSDAMMSLVGAAGAILAGVVLGQIGYDGLALSVGAAVIAVVVLSPVARLTKSTQEPAHGASVS